MKKITYELIKQSEAIDYSRVMKKIREERERGIHFLERSIKGL